STDLANTGMGGSLTTTNSIAITVNAVNDAPVNTLQSAMASLNEDGTLVFDAVHANLITVNDSADTVQASGVDNLATTVSVTHGTLTATLNGATLTNNGAGSITIAGTAAQVNAALAGLIYTPNADYNGSDTLTITSSDLANTGMGGSLTTTNSIAITVNAVNDAPVNTLQAATVSLNEDGTLVFDAVHANLITVDDNSDTSQANGVDSLSTTVSVTHGTLTATLSGATLSNNGSGSITIAGTAAQVNAALAGLIYTPNANYNGTDTLTISSTDLANTGMGGVLTSTNSIAITVNSVNDAPSGANKSITILEDSSYTFSIADFGFTDPKDNPIDSFNRVLITTLPGQGQLTVGGTLVSAGHYIPVADITSGKLAFTPVTDANGNNYASFSFQVEDQGGTSNNGVNLDPVPKIMNININSVNDPPVLYGKVADFSGKESQPFTLSLPAGLFTDSDIGSDTLTVSASLAGGSPLPNGLNFDANTMAFHGMNAVPGSYLIRITATDMAGANVSTEFKMTIAFTDLPLKSSLQPISDSNAGKSRASDNTSSSDNTAIASVVKVSSQLAAVALPVTSEFSSSSVFAAPVIATIEASPYSVAASSAPASALTVVSGPAAVKDFGSKPDAGGASSKSFGNMATTSVIREAHVTDTHADSGLPTSSSASGSSGLVPSPSNAPIAVKGFSGGYDEKGPSVVVQGFSDSGAGGAAVGGFSGRNELLAPVIVPGFGDSGASRDNLQAAKGFGDTSTPVAGTESGPLLEKSGKNAVSNEEFAGGAEELLKKNKAVSSHSDGEGDIDQLNERAAKKATVEDNTADGEEIVKKLFGKRSFTAQLRQFGRVGFHESSMRMLKDLIENRPSP
ncbi:MAG: putative Ig domain-containing protein, partial [Magnetococcales bacterium]|nr:putative Ig domain-containing protein [Magnetococcales bacterium]